MKTKERRKDRLCWNETSQRRSLTERISVSSVKIATCTLRCMRVISTIDVGETIPSSMDFLFRRSMNTIVLCEETRRIRFLRKVLSDREARKHHRIGSMMTANGE